MIKRAKIKDSSSLAHMAVKMWQDSSVLELEEEFKEIIHNDNAVVFIKFADEKPIGFAQCQLRFDYVEGTQTSPVGYLEGVFIDEQYRNNGYAKELLMACENWVKEKTVRNLRVTVSLRIIIVINFIWQLDLQKKTE